MDLHDNQEDEQVYLAAGPSPRPENEREPQSPEGETSTCRICRGEETSDEPLFYPCKCSGSIRFVHQACLMEWLSRSGKRHCELCKTPFRFTKLYDPSMPASVPIPVFARQACVQILAATLRVLRWALVLFVWLAWVPWAMRLMWRFLFWLADGAWIEHPFHYDVGLPGSLGTLSITAYSRKGLENSTVGDQIAEVAHAVSNSTSKPNILRLFSDHVSSILWDHASAENATSSQPLMLRLGTRLFRGIFPLAGRRASGVDTNLTSSMGPPFQTRTTLLSDVGYLKNFTKWPYVNRIIMDILEGQMITIFVMVFLVLVFLIREWVVQQQPGAGAPRLADRQPGVEDRPAAENNENNNDDGPRQRTDQQEDTEDTAQQFDSPDEVGTSGRPFVPYREHDSSSNTFIYHQNITVLKPYESYSFEELRLADYENDQLGPWRKLSTSSRVLGDLASVPSLGTPLERQASLHGNLSSPQLPRPAFDIPQNEAQTPVSDASPEIRYDLPRNLLGQSVSDDAWSTTAIMHDSPELENNSESYQNQRPQMPSRNALDKASRLHRVLEEERNKVGGDRWPGITTFMDFWNRGNCDPNEVLQLIHNESREEELAWIVKAMRRLQKAEDSDSDVLTHQTSAAQPVNPAADNQELSTSSHGSWQVVEDIPILENATAQAAGPVQDGNPDLIETPAMASRSHSAPNPRLNILGQDWGTSSQARGEETEADANVAPGQSVSWTTGSDPTGTSRSDARQDFHVEPPPLHEDPGPPDETPGGDDAGEAPVDPGVPSTVDNETGEAAPQSAWQSLGDMMWGDVELLPAEQERVAGQLQPVLQPEMEHDPAQAPQQPHADPDIDGRANEGGAAPGPGPGPGPGPDPEVLRAAREAGINPEDAQAIEEAEELDGLVELIGLEGPLIALLQHAVVCAAIVSLVVFLGVWIPYILGKVMLVIISNPITLLVKLPLRCVLFVFEVLLDAAIVLLTTTYFYIDNIVRSLVSPVGWMIPVVGRIQSNRVISDTALSFSHDSLQRLVQGFSFGGDGLADSDIPYFSIVAHESLVTIKGFAYDIVAGLYRWLCETLQATDLAHKSLLATWYIFLNIPAWTFRQMKWELAIAANVVTGLLSVLATNPLKLRLDFPERSVPLDLNLIHWSAWDRFFAILLGYLALYAVGSVYTRVIEAFRNPEDQQDEAVEIIYQACGVLKVILIISIEMIAFPLYCGILLDIAMLPLFREATFLSRLAFTARSPWTSLFLHWFVGTCYMFHFALFVSMCRKEMRSGVLYFIRDPDDETFHPVRDVLERNLGGQLRKIAFSALVYGALVIVCLGTVVWGVGSLPLSVFPVTWSTDHPLDELPIDLCVYNFLIPIAIRALDPSQALTDMYKWWFRRCAKLLRLSHFLFGERRLVEEGVWEKAEPSESFLISSDDDEGDGDDAGLETPSMPDEDVDAMEIDFSFHTTAQEKISGQEQKERRFIRDGRFVRAPATDRVRIPRGHRTFLPVDENNNRTDGEPEATEGLHAKSNNHFQLVYLPPHFQVRIGLFAVLLWAFAAVTGLLTTVLPLAIGRVALSLLVPESVPTNDIHAYVFGAYTLGTPLLLALRHKQRLTATFKGTKIWMKRGGIDVSRITSTITKIAKILLRVLRVLYFYSFAGFVLPTLFSAVFWFYVAIPAYTFTGSKVFFEDHITHISLVQNWVLGVLFMRVVGRVVHSHQESRITRALYAIVRNNNGAGWSDPDVKLATRALIFPSLLAATVALLAPLSLGFVANVVYFQSRSPELPILVYRYSYPVVAGMVALFFFMRFVRGAYSKWRSRIRDEVYLVGERLHNFGERRSMVTDRITSSA